MSLDTTTPTQDIYEWFEKAFPERSDRLVELQLGVMYEEVTESLKALGLPFHELQQTADHLKEGRYTDFIGNSLKDPDIRTELLDALCDNTVTNVGVAYAADMDYETALKEVVRSNDSKFDENGNPIYDDITGKLRKGEFYTPPELHEAANR